MQLFPIKIRRYKTEIESECFIRKIRANTIYQYNDQGFLRDYNPNNLLFRNEKSKGIYLKEQRNLKARYGGGTTAIFISEDEKGKTLITSVAYFGWQQSLILSFLFLGFFYSIFNNLSSIINFVQNASKCSYFSKNNEGITGYFKVFLRQR